MGNKFKNKIKNKKNKIKSLVHNSNIIVARTIEVKLWLIIELKIYIKYLSVLKYRNKCLKHLET